MRTARLLLVCLLTSTIAQAQHHMARDPDLEKFLEHFAQQDADLNYEELYENLTQLLLHPLQLNKVSAEELRATAMFTETQVNDLVAHRDKFGHLISIYELQVIPSFTLDFIEAVAPFFIVHERATDQSLATKVFHEKNNYLSIRFDRSLSPIAASGEPDSLSKHLGSSTRVFTRFRVSRPGEYSIGFTLEKDAGEQLAFKRMVPSFDFWSAHMQWKGTRWLRNVMVGDFTAQLGQGLVLGSGFGAGKGSETILTVRRSSLGFLPYTSATEHGFMRGAALTLSPFRVMKIHLFASQLKRDAQLRGDSASFITAFDVTGLHRNLNERAKENTVTERNLGAAIELTSNHLHAGVSVHHLNYSVPLHPEINPYNHFRFQGDTHTNASAYATYGWHNFSLFSEVATDRKLNVGAIAGIIGSISSRLDISILARYYHPGYFSPYANALSENTSPANERAIYWGWKFQPRRKILIAGYLDMFDFTWLRFRAYRPSSGLEYLLRVSYKPIRAVEIIVQGREERKERNSAVDEHRYYPEEHIKRNFFVSMNGDAGKLKLKTRIQGSTLSTRSSFTTVGFVILQDLSYDWGRLSLSGRYALFGTDDFDNRQYVYETDVWSAFSFPAYYGEGIRSVAMARYNFSKHLDIWIRWARTTYVSSRAPSDAADLPQGSRSDVKLQIRWRI